MYRLRTHLFRALVLPLVFLAGCGGGSPPRGVIPEEEFVGLYLDLLTAAERSNETPPAAITAPADSVLKRRGVTLEEYRSTVAWYNRDPESWRSFFAEVIRKGPEREARSLEDGTPTTGGQR
jgi:hypothetical protein